MNIQSNSGDAKPNEGSTYVAKITYEVRGENIDNKITCYLDAIKSKSEGNYADHSCNNNAVLYKMIKSNDEVPMLWRKSVIDIRKGEEMFISNGDKYEQILADKEGCHCEKWLNKKFVGANLNSKIKHYFYINE